MRITTLGTSHGSAEPGRFCCATLVDAGGRRYLFDCGAPVDALLTNRGETIFEVSAVFISHMHEDHVGALTSVAKRFMVYQRDRSVEIFLPEDGAIEAYVNWCAAMHMALDERVRLRGVRPGRIFDDGVMRVSAIPTQHIAGFPTYAYLLEAEGRRVVITGDLAADFHDYPQVVFERDFDAVVSELTHFSIAAVRERVAKSRTKQLIFTHIYPANLTAIQPMLGEFPFPVHLAEDGATYEV